jgi:type II secretory pathway pseudopilin PulG
MMQRQSGMTLVELLVMICIVCVLFTLGMAHLFRVRARANEASAVASLRVIGQGQLTYSVACGSGGFAPNLQVLARPVPGSSTPFVPPDVSAQLVTLKSGYLLTVRPAFNAVTYKVDCHGMLNSSSYYASARPATYGVGGGTQSFALSMTGVVWAIDAPMPPSEPLGPPAVPFR